MGAVITLLEILGGGALLNSLITFFTKKVGVVAAYSAAFLAGWTALQIAMYALVQSIGYITPTFMQPVIDFIYLMLPSNFFTCVDLMISARIGVWLWNERKEFLRVVAGSS